jgi:hypothetical protein
LGVIEEVEGGHLDALISQRVAEAKVPLAVVEPWKGIACTIKLGKFNFVQGVHPINGMVAVALCPPMPTSVVWAPARVWRRHRPIAGTRGGGSDVCYADASSPSPCTSCSRQMRDTPSAVCWALTSRRSPVMVRTNSSNQSRCWTTSSMARPISFPKLDPIARGMVAHPGLADTRMSWARALERYG